MGKFVASRTASLFLEITLKSKGICLFFFSGDHRFSRRSYEHGVNFRGPPKHGGKLFFRHLPRGKRDKKGLEPQLYIVFSNP